MDQTSSSKSYYQKFTAVDLMTIALFSLILRFVFYYIHKAFYLAFPWNEAFFPIFVNLTLVICLVIVNKGGTLLFWSISWWLINLFIQGEDLFYAAGLIPIFLIAEGSLYVMWKLGSGHSDLKSLIVGVTVYQTFVQTWNWWALENIFLIPFPFMTAFIPVILTVLIVSGPIGIYFGNILGYKLKEVIG